MKVEDKLTSAIRKVTTEEYDRISEYVLHIFFAGFVAGILFSLSNLAPLSIGIMGGYILAKKNFTMMNMAVTRLTMFLTVRWSNIEKQRVGYVHDVSNDDL